nr:hypothetical protein [Tanacetum cinerariifolium]
MRMEMNNKVRMEEMGMEETEDMEMEGMGKWESWHELWRFHANGSRVHFSRLLEVALTWWNSHKRTIGIDVAYA